MPIETFVDGLEKWKLLLNEGNELTDELKETILTLSKGVVPKIGLAIIGEYSVAPFGITEELNFEDIDKCVKKSMQTTLNNPPDMDASVFYDEKEENIVGGFITMNGGTMGVISKENLKLNKDETVDAMCCFIARLHLLEDCKNNNIIGYLIPNIK